MPLPFGFPSLAGASPSVLEKLWDFNQRVQSLGFRDIGGNDTKVRFLASLATEHVHVHVQHDGGGAGGAEYDPDNFDAQSATVNCREERQQEVTIARDGANHFYVFLIPVWEATPGVFEKFDGEEHEDRMVTLDLGI